MVIILNTIGCVASLIQKFLIYRNKNNVALNINQISLELTCVVTGILIIQLYQNTKFNTLLTDTCSKVMEISEADTQIIDKVYTMRNPREGEANFKILMSVVIVQSSLMSIMMLQRTQYLGELIMMLSQMMSELTKFFATFGLIIGLFLLIGRLMSTEIKNEPATFF